jgi:hypothetical protein
MLSQESKWAINRQSHSARTLCYMIEVSISRPNIISFESVLSMGESASRPPCGFWRIDDQQLDI